MIAQDEQERIEQSILSCMHVADEIVVVDGGSKDNTVQIAERLGCRVIHHAFEGYAKQRNFAADQAVHDWIFFIDADEIVSKPLALSIMKWKENKEEETAAYAVYRIGNFLNKWFEQGEYLVRLYHRKRVKINDTHVHERPDVEEDKTGQLEGVLWHNGFRSIEDHVQRFNRYTKLEAEQAYEQKQKFHMVNMLWRPPAKFVQKYMVHQLYKKGVAGFAVAVFWSYYEFMKQIKLYEKYMPSSSLASKRGREEVKVANK